MRAHARITNSWYLPSTIDEEAVDRWFKFRQFFSHRLALLEDHNLDEGGNIVRGCRIRASRRSMRMACIGHARCTPNIN